MMGRQARLLGAGEARSASGATLVLTPHGRVRFEGSGGAESELDAVWDDLVAMSTTNVDLSGTVDHNTLEGYTAGWETVGGVKCRALRCRLGCFFAQPTAYAAST